MPWATVGDVQSGQGGLLMYWKNVRLNHLNVKGQAPSGNGEERADLLEQCSNDTILVSPFRLRTRANAGCLGL